MNLGHRFFVINGHEVKKLAQKTFSAFHMRGEAALPEYGGQEVTIAIVMYELKNRKPHRIFRIDCSKMRVQPDGSLDEEHYSEGFQLAMNPPRGTPRVGTMGENVVDAEGLFNRRKLDNLHPKLSGPAQKKILEHLFG